MAPGQPCCFICSWWGRNGILCLQHKRGACRPSPCLGCGATPVGRGGPTLTIEVDVALSLLHVSEVLFHPVPVWFVSFMVSLLPANQAVGRYPGTAAPGGRQQELLAWHNPRDLRCPVSKRKEGRERGRERERDEGERRKEGREKGKEK